MIKRILRKLKGSNSEIDFLLNQGFKMGDNCIIYSDNAIDSNFPWLIELGNHVIISTNVKLLAHDASTGYVNKHTKIGIVKVGSEVFIGSGTTVLCNTRIGDNVIIGAISVVANDLPSNGVYAGNPAKFICSIEEFKDKHIKNLDNKPVFKKPWYEWRNATKEEKEEMKNALQDTFGYVK